MAISERTPWMPGKIVGSLWEEGNKFIVKRLKSNSYRNHRLEKVHAFMLVETSAAEANRAITNMMITVTKDSNHE